MLIFGVYLLAVAGPAFYARRGALARFLWIELALACLFFWAVVSAQSIRWVSARAGAWGPACMRELRAQEEQGNTVFAEPLACEKAREEARDFHEQAETTAGLLLSLGLGCFLGAAVYRREERVELTRKSWMTYPKPSG
ncbi:MAG: hypothetical protein ACRD4D_06600 [Candidatus Acidiferrales bacterium]